MKHAYRNAESWHAEYEECADSTLADAREGWPLGHLLAGGLHCTDALHRSALWTLVWLLTPEDE